MHRREESPSRAALRADRPLAPAPDPPARAGWRPRCCWWITTPTSERMERVAAAGSEQRDSMGRGGGRVWGPLKAGASSWALAAARVGLRLAREVTLAMSFKVQLETASGLGEGPRRQARCRGLRAPGACPTMPGRCHAWSSRMTGPQATSRDQRGCSCLRLPRIPSMPWVHLPYGRALPVCPRTNPAQTPAQR